MSVDAIFDIKTKSWQVNYGLDAYHSSVDVTFLSFEPSKNLKFSYGFSVSKNGQIYFEVSYPPEGVSLVAVDDTYACLETVETLPDKNLDFLFWVEINGERFEKFDTVTVPKPEKPYPSWVWNEVKWEPPIPEPEDTELEPVWNEGKVAWDFIEK